MLLIAVSACDHVGSSLVDSRAAASSKDGISMACAALPRCDGGPRPELPKKPEAVPIDFEACGEPQLRCEDDNEDELERSDLGALAQCTRPATLDEWSAAGGTLEACAAHRIANLDANEARELTLEGVVWMHVEVAFETATPLSITLTGATLEDVFVRLEGPVTLRVVDSAQFDAVRIVSSPSGALLTQAGLASSASRAVTAAELPGVELDAVAARDLWLDGDEGFEGAVHVAHSRLSGGYVTTHDLAVESTRLEAVQLRTRELKATDAVIADSQLAIDRGLISASHFSASDVLRCSALTFVATALEGVRLLRCDDPLRLYDSVVARSDLEGDIESDGLDRSPALHRANAHAHAQAARRVSSIPCPDQQRAP
jgi:hypothetical protein